jgi:hypothetical protein
MPVIAYCIGKRILWGFNVEVTPWPHDGKLDVIVGSIAMPPAHVVILDSKTEKKLLAFSKRILKLQEESQQLVEKAYPTAQGWNKPPEPPGVVDGVRIRNPNATPEDQCAGCPDKNTQRCNTTQCKVE